VRALRGAITVEGTDAAAPGVATQLLLGELLAQNALALDDVISALFTVTPDLYSAAPARAAREAGWHDVPMLTASEAPAERSLARCIRVLVHVQTTRTRGEMRHVYLGGARSLRPDLVAEAEEPH
jgi:chorismate mutase